MAGYPPPPSYGPAPGQRGQALPFQYTTAQTIEYPYAIPSQSANISAFEQNAATLPGFEFNTRPPPFNPTGQHPGVPPPLPAYHGLDPNALRQNPMWAAPTRPPGVPASLESSTGGIGSVQSQIAMQPELVPQGSITSTAIHRGQQAVEEGELSEGEYEEADTRSIPGSGREKIGRYSGYMPNQTRHSNGTVNQQPNSFEKTTTIPPTDPFGRSRDAHRQSSDSYSPPSSGPTVLAPATSRESDVRLQTGMAHNLPTQQEQERVYIPGRPREEWVPNSQIENRRTALVDEQLPDKHSEVIPGSGAKSVQDARKQAQKAVLNLLPLKVRFQNFVDEGIDEEVVRSVFNDIGMSPSYTGTKPLISGIEQPQQVAEHATDLNSHPVSTSTVAPQSRHNKNTMDINGGQQPSNSQQAIMNTVPITNKGEERKDRIARLLEEKNKRNLNSTQPISPVTATLSDNILTSKSTASQSTAKVDKEKLLKAKMEALQKSREARAQRATTKLATEQIIQSTSTGPVLPLKPQTQIIPSTTEYMTSLPHDPRTYSPSTQQLEPRTSMPSIPGLFLANTTSIVQSSTTQSSSTAQNINNRKRPVASDFDSNATTATTYKRPFGHSRNDQPLVIDVSEEESDDESMELEIDDQIADVSTRDIQTGSPLRPGLRDLPPLSDFPPKKTFTAPTSALSTPPSLAAPQRSSTRPEDLKRKEFEIQEMRRKIAEAEQRKKAKLMASGSQTPMQKTTTLVESRSAKDASISNKIDTSIQIELLINDASRKIEEDQQKLAQAQALEEHNSEDLKQKEVEQRRQRRARIAADLPVVDAEVQESQKKLAELREEMANLELAVQKQLEEKRRLAEEMEKLSHEVDDQLEAQRDRLKSLTSDIAMAQEGMSFVFFFVAAYVVMTTLTLLLPLLVEEDPSAHSIVDSQGPLKSADAPAPPIDSNKETMTDQQDVQMSDYQPSTESPTSQAPGVNPEPTSVDGQSSVDPILSPTNVELMVGKSQPGASPAEEQLISSLIDDQSSEAIVAGSLDESDTNQGAVDSTEIAMVGSPASQLSFQGGDQSETTPMDLSLDDSNESSHHGTDNIEESVVDDAESMQSKDMDIDEPCLHDSDASIDSQDQNALLPASLRLESDLAGPVDGDSDTYEPPEATPPSSNEFIAANSPPFSPQYPEPATGASGTDHEMLLAPLSDATEPTTSTRVSLPRLSNDEDESGKSLERKSFFTPYESPLKRFKAYRFHPEFTKEVPGGYKSLTYSNNIDARKELCRFELAGGVCNDLSCEFQHFRDVVLPDELILVALGNSAGYKEEDKMRFIKGLKEVLQDLRISKIRDFQVIASKICLFRQGFFEDKTKVLLLDS